MVCESLDKMNATRLVIAHRLSTIINCDRILVMDEGKIVEQGRYQELMDARGLFYDLASRQIL
jgi:ATP-binding cassette subfamily C protein